MARRDYTSTRPGITSSIVARATARDILSLAGFPAPNRAAAATRLEHVPQ